MRLPTAVSLSSALLLLVLAPDAGAQGGRRPAPAAEILAARQAFTAGIAAVSRNPSAFLQEARATPGCSVVLTSSRVDGADSLHESQTFEAGLSWSAPRMSIAPSGGVIIFTYVNTKGAEVARESRRAPREPAVPTTTTGVAPTVAGKGRDLTLLVAETSQQADVVALTAAWAALVRACGGEVAP
ncbi:MAG: hypothetical protein V4617_16345 [Gemmatimonadota bacterium]